MRFDSLGLPQDNGSNDFQDSARLAGLMTVFDYPRVVDLRNYVIGYGKYVRHPREYIYKFSRDQAVVLLAGLYTQGLEGLVNPKYKTEGDFVSPSVRGHFKRCAGLKANWLENAWLWLDVAWGIWIKPDDETNQLLCMLWIADKKYLTFYLKHKTTWRNNIREYWCAWRNESDLAECMINNIQRYE